MTQTEPNQADFAAAAAGLSEGTEPERVKPEIVDAHEVVDVDTTAEKDDDGVTVGAPATAVHPTPEATGATTTQGMALVPFRQELLGATEMAVTLAVADNLPPALRRKPESVLAVILTGRELGVAPMTAIRTFHVIDGQVTVAPKVRAAMVRQQKLGKLWPDPGNDDEEATWFAERADSPGIVYHSTYTMAMARAVKISSDKFLADKDNWQNYPARMLSWRALGYVLDDAYPEVGTGLYSPDELGAVTDEEGNPAIDVASTENLAVQVKRNRQDPQSPADPPASPDTLDAFRRRISTLRSHEGAAAALQVLWAQPLPDGSFLPKLTDLRYSDCRRVSALIGSVEVRVGRGEFPEAPQIAQEPSGGAAEGDKAQPPPEALREQEEDESEQEVASPLFDPEGLPEEQTAPADLLWADRCPDDILEALIAEVKAIPKDELVATLKACNRSANGSEDSKRAKIAAYRARARMERLLRP